MARGEDFEKSPSAKSTGFVESTDGSDRNSVGGSSPGDASRGTGLGPERIGFTESWSPRRFAFRLFFFTPSASMRFEKFIPKKMHKIKYYFFTQFSSFYLLSYYHLANFIFQDLCFYTLILSLQIITFFL